MDAGNRKPRIEDVPNKNHVADVKYAIQHTRWFLMGLGLWPSVTAEPTRLQRYFARIGMLACMIAIVLTSVCLISHTVFRMENIHDALRMFGSLNSEWSIAMKYFVMIYRRDRLKVVIQSIEANWRCVETSKERKIMIEHLKRGRNISTACGVIMYGNCGIFYLVPYLAGPYINELNQSVRSFPYPGPDMFLDIQSGYNYEILYLLISCMACINLLIVLTTYHLAAVLVTHACGQIQIVISRLNDLVGFSEETNDIVVVNDRIAFIVRNHVGALRFATEVEEIMQEICLVEVVAATLSICWCEYWILMTDDLTGKLTFALLLIMYIINIFVFCYFGELLQMQFEQVGEVSYMIDWHRLPGKTSLALVMVITMANCPCNLTAGKVMKLSYFSFGSVIKASFGYLNMMRSMSQQ